jgi:hypothetical protein
VEKGSLGSGGALTLGVLRLRLRMTSLLKKVATTKAKTKITTTVSPLRGSQTKSKGKGHERLGWKRVGRLWRGVDPRVLRLRLRMTPLLKKVTKAKQRQQQQPMRGFFIAFRMTAWVGWSVRLGGWSLRFGGVLVGG